MKDQEYAGFETGPIRPPSEAASLYLRVSRNCPWNKCRFCPVYKGQHFSRRPVEHVLRDIDLVADHVEALDIGRGPTGKLKTTDRAERGVGGQDPRASQVALHWMAAGGRTVFLQDANALGASYEDLLQILLHLKRRLPWVERVTSYARSQSLLRLSPEQLGELRAAGLRRIHVGFESGSDKVLAIMQKGATKSMHLEAGLRVKEAGIELSAYYMPGLGGRSLLSENAWETADLVQKVAPDFLRLRTLAIPDRAPLAEDAASGLFEKAGEVETVQEILLFLEQVGDIDCRLFSDHLVNLIQDLNGNLARDRQSMILKVRAFLEMEPESRRTYMVGRRMGVFTGPGDMEDPQVRGYVEAECRRLGVTEENIDALMDSLTKHFV